MILRSSSSPNPKAPKPLSSRTNNSSVHPAQTRKTTKNLSSGIPRLSFRRFGGKARHQRRRSDGDGRRPTPPEADAKGVEKRQSQGELDDEDDVQYIDLDVVVTASPGTEEVMWKAPIDGDRKASVPPRSGERKGLKQHLNDDLVVDPPASLSNNNNDNAAAKPRPSCPGTPPRSRRDDGTSTSLLVAAPSPPRRSSSPAAYQLPDSLRKRRRGSGQRILWRDSRISNEERSPSPPVDGPDTTNDEWNRVRKLGREDQLAAFWNLLYPDQPRNTVPLAAGAGAPQGLPLRSCMKRKRRERNADEDSSSKETVVDRKVLQWGSNSAVEFNMQTAALDLLHLSPATVELRFPATLDGYEELHPVDEEMMQLTKDNSAILAALEDFDDSSSSESSIGSPDDDDAPHCFQDTDDDDDDYGDDYRPSARRLSSATRNSRRASGIFTPEPFLDSAASPDPVPPSSPGVVSPFDKLSLTSPPRGPAQTNLSGDEHVFIARTLLSVAKQGLNDLPTTAGHASGNPFVLSIDGEESVEKSADHGATSVGALTVSTWQQKLSQVCLSPVSGAMDIVTVPPLEKICSKFTGLVGDESEFFTGVTSSSPLDLLEWLEPFDTCASLRTIVDRSFLLARGAMSLLPPVNSVSCFDEEVESLAQSEWLEVEIKVLEALVFQLASGLMQDASTECDRHAQQALKIGKVSRIRALAAQEERALLLKETELRKLQCDFERLKQLQTRRRRDAVVRARYSTHLLQAASPFSLTDTDGVVTYLAFPTPVQGLGVAAIHTVDEPLVIDSEYLQGSSTASNGIDTRFDPSHPCSTFYASLLNACLKNLGEFCLASGMGSLLVLEVLLGRLEGAFWDVHHFYSMAPNATIGEYDTDGTSFVVVSASVDSDSTFHVAYDCSDLRTLYTCRPTCAQLNRGDDTTPISRSYPPEPLMVLMEELVRLGPMDPCTTL